MDRQIIDDALAILYKDLIDKSWMKAEAYEAYQDAWKAIEETFKVKSFDWTKGERPQTNL